MKYAILGWIGKRSKRRPAHLILWRRDGTVRDGDVSFCGMVHVGCRDWEIQPVSDWVCKRCLKFSRRYEETVERQRMWR